METESSGSTGETDRSSEAAAWDRVYQAESKLEHSTYISWLEAGFSNPRLLFGHYPVARLVRHLSLPLESSIEIGCGSGKYSLVLKKLGLVRKTVLMDFSASALESAERLFRHFNESCTLVQAEFQQMPFADNSFDLAFSGGLIEHFRTWQEKHECFKAHLNVSRTVIIQAPASSPFYWIQRGLVTVLKRGWPFGFERPLSLDELKSYSDHSDGEIAAVDYQYFLNFLIFVFPSLASTRAFLRPKTSARFARTDLAVLVKRPGS